MFWSTFFTIVKQAIFWFFMAYGVLVSGSRIFDEKFLDVRAISRWPFVVIFVVCIVLMAISVLG